MQDKQEMKAQMRVKILDCASEILAEQGAQALSMRKLSQRVGASTIVLYTYFENKQDIFEQLYLEGFARLKQALEAVPDNADTLEYMVELGRAYYANALDNPTYYELMFTQCTAEFTPSASSRTKSMQSLNVIGQAVQQGLNKSLIAGGSVEALARMCWTTVHGVTSLQLFGYFSSKEEGQQQLELALRLMRDGLAAQ